MTDTSADDPHPAPPADVGGYEVLRELRPGATYLARAPGGRLVVLKMLDPDCLLTDGQLHPLIRDRLGRVRELAHARVANLHAVERDAGRAYLVWEHVEGTTLEAWVEGGHGSPRELLLVARELVLCVEALHARGIVHGAVHGGNVLLGPQLQVKLTHVSPLLYDDPRQDADDVSSVLAELVALRGPDAAALADLAATGSADLNGDPLADSPLRALSDRLSLLLEHRDGPAPRRPARRDHTRRARSLAIALGMAAVIVAIFLGIRAYVDRLAPRPAQPPEAPPAALEP